ncbi:Hydroperoxide isomerase aloxe3 [Chytridiales sp. JEL 0842]|nr:Hydroperoxide isomerase aloxe3 [Chytridiales sp. JEL 0842]
MNADDDATTYRTAASAVRAKGAQELKHLFVLVGVIYATFFSIGLWQSFGKYEPVTSLDSFFFYNLTLMYIFSNTFLIFHHFAVQAFVKALRGYNNPEKTAMYCIYLFEVSSLVYRDDYIRFTVSGATVMVTLQVYTVMTYTYEIAYIGSRNMSPMLKLHHITCITLQTVGVAMTVDFIPHGYLLARKFSAPVAIQYTFGYLSQWPLTILRNLINCLLVAVTTFILSTADIKTVGLKWAWVVILMSATILLAITQVWCHFVYQDLMAKDRSRHCIKSSDNQPEGGEDDITVENLEITGHAESTHGRKFRATKDGRATSKVLVLRVLIAMQVVGPLASILAVALNRRPRVCDAQYNDGLYITQNDPDPSVRRDSVAFRRSGFEHVWNGNATLPPGIGGTAGLTYSMVVHGLLLKDFIPWSAKVNQWNMQTHLASIAENTTIQSLADFDFVYRYFGKPKGAVPAALTDAYFGRSKVTWSPEYLTIVKSISSLPMNITDADVSNITSGKTLADLVQQKRLFAVDHRDRMLRQLQPQYRRPGVYACAPAALFFVDDAGNLMPLAMQLNPNDPIFTPNDNWDWQLAKMAYTSTETYERWSFYNSDPTTDLPSRGVEFIPNNPYHKYVTRLYQASQQLFSELINIFYPDDSSVVRDLELQAFAADVAVEGGVRGFPEMFKTREELSRALAHLHYLCTTHHAVMNGESLGFRGALPTAPLALYKELPKVKGSVTERNIVDWLPSLEQSLAQVRFLTSFTRPLPDHERLPNMFTGFKINSPKTRCVLQNYRHTLLEISKDVQRDAATDAIVPGWTIMDPFNIPAHVYT